LEDILGCYYPIQPMQVWLALQFWSDLQLLTSFDVLTVQWEIATWQLLSLPKIRVLLEKSSNGVAEGMDCVLHYYYVVNDSDWHTATASSYNGERCCWFTWLGFSMKLRWFHDGAIGGGTVWWTNESSSWWRLKMVDDGISKLMWQCGDGGDWGHWGFEANLIFDLEKMMMWQALIGSYVWVRIDDMVCFGWIV